jgi:hypothetical protein
VLIAKSFSCLRAISAFDDKEHFNNHMYQSFNKHLPFFCFSKRKEQRKGDHENQPPAFVFTANALHHIATKLAVRSFRGQPPHQYQWVAVDIKIHILF